MVAEWRLEWRLVWRKKKRKLSVNEITSRATTAFEATGYPSRKSLGARVALKRQARPATSPQEPQSTKIGGDRKALRREGAKIGQRYRDRSRCVWVLPDCLCGVKPILIGVYHHNIDFATFTSVYFAPKRKASMIADQLLKSPERVRRKFRARTDKPEIAFYNGRFNVYSD